jgi:hypothetical protein
MTERMTRAEKRRLADEFIKRTDPYTHHDFPAIDLRAYIQYVKDHNLMAKDVTPEIMEMFIKKE